MATTDHTSTAIHTEPCEECGTNASVSLQLIKEGECMQSQEPYRVVSCGHCGYETKTRMNDV